MDNVSYSFDAADYINGYGISGGIEASMCDLIWSIYVGIANEQGVEPMDEEEFADMFYNGGNAGYFRHEVEDYIKFLGLEW